MTTPEGFDGQRLGGEISNWPMNILRYSVTGDPIRLERAKLWREVYVGRYATPYQSEIDNRRAADAAVLAFDEAMKP